MPDDIADPGAATGGADEGAGDGAVDNTADNVVDDAPDASTDGPDKADEVDEEAEAAALLGKDDEGKDKPDGAKDDPPPADTDANQEKVEPKSIAEARAHITRLEGQLETANQVHAKVLEIGGLEILEMARPLIDAATNPEATAGDIIEAIAAINGQHNPQDLAWGLVEENRDAVVAHFCGDNITPAILEKLVDKFEAGEIDLDDSDDDVFAPGGDKAAGKDKPDAAAKQAEKAAETLSRETARKEATDNVATICSGAVESVMAPYAVKDGDSDGVKTLKGFLNRSVQAQIMFELHSNPVFTRTQGLIKNNGGKAAEGLARGRLAVDIAKRTEALIAEFQPFVEAAIGKSQAAAKKITKVRGDLSGASTQADVVPQQDEELSATDPKWREKLDAQYARKMKAITDRGRGTRRDHAGKFSGTGK